MRPNGDRNLREDFIDTIEPCEPLPTQFQVSQLIADEDLHIPTLRLCHRGTE